MQPRPKHLTVENASRFKEQSVVDRYPLRLPYPPQTFDFLADLLTDEPRTLLDAGTGTGEIARAMARRVARVDAVDFSQAMIALGQTLPGGDSPNLVWRHGRAEDVVLDPLYALVTTGESLHWMDWEVVLPRFHRVLTAHGYLAIVHRSVLPVTWQEDLSRLVSRYSTTIAYEDFDLIALLEERRLFEPVGEWQSTPVATIQTIDDYIAGQHSQSSLSLAHMPPADAAAFDAELRRAIMTHSESPMYVTLHTYASVVWGRPKDVG